MSTTMKTPGVYIQELDAFGNAVVPVPTAVPAFIGYTAQTSFNGKSLLNKAVKVTSLAEFLQIFGNTPPKTKYSLKSDLLPEREDILKKYEAAAQKEKDAADKAVTTAGDNVTDDQTNAATKAGALLGTVKAELADVQADAKIKALSDAKKALAANEDGSKTDDLTAKVKDAQQEIDKIVNDAHVVSNGYAYTITQKNINYRMYSAMKFFYENGGSDCYVMTVGAYDYSKPSITDTTAFTDAITLLKKETEPTMLVIPDVVEIRVPNAETLADKYANAYSLQSAMINHCGEEMNRVAILDIPGGFSEPVTGTKSFEQFRSTVEPTIDKFNSYAAAYYPWLHTTVYQTSEISYQNVDEKSRPLVIQLLNTDFRAEDGSPNTDMQEKVINAFDPDNAENAVSLDKADLILQNLSKSYQLLMGAIQREMNLIPPSAGMAGIYTSVDTNEGVWIAPANVGIQSTIAPAIKIDNKAQEDLNVPISGKAVCAIRAFTGRGNLVWGARTLDGNSNDWRYINIRRTLIFIEQSVKDAAKAYVFAPNDSSTWIAVKGMISSFLTGLWKQGALVGPKPADSFSVSVGLGSTMTNDDILQGIMRVMVKVALSHPAEFIEITFQQEMQKA